jgi:hypothetical protein
MSNCYIDSLQKIVQDKAPAIRAFMDYMSDDDCLLHVRTAARETSGNDDLLQEAWCTLERQQIFDENLQLRLGVLINNAMLFKLVWGYAHKADILPGWFISTGRKNHAGAAETAWSV